MTVREMRNRARAVLVLAFASFAVGWTLLLTLPAMGYALTAAAFMAAVVGGHLHGAADERGRAERERA